MKKLLTCLMLTTFLFSCSKDEISPANDNQFASDLRTSNTSVQSLTSKKGVGLVESMFGATQLDLLGVSWYYSWGFTTGVTTTKEFVPMVFSLNTIPHITPSNTILGFNEPDNSSQSNMTVPTAIANWAPLVSNSVRVGSPGTAGNPLTSGSWQTQFMTYNPNPKVDFVCVHWYKGPNITKFKSDMLAIIQKYNKPIWITEFAPQTVSSSTADPNKYTQAQVTAFINAVIPWMNGQTMIERYAWHDSKSGTSALFTTSGQLTATGIAYRDSH